MPTNSALPTGGVMLPMQRLYTRIIPKWMVLEVFDKNKPANADSLPVPLLVCIKFRGSVTDVTAAVEAGMEVANRMTGVVQHYVIPNPEEGTEKMLKISALDKD